ncbi:MAG TPA: CGNR zinc finger domain-containing protein [Jatrophihabitantaceae bacterium]|jgi:predicted RNA-binding Zn ribbon-like protein
MARQVDGVWLPERVSGHPALELNNTVGGWSFPQPREYLVDYGALIVLARDVDLVSPADAHALLTASQQSPRQARSALRDVKRLRSALHATMVDDSVDAAAELRTFVANAVRASRYVSDEASALRLDGGAGLRMPLHRFTLSLATLLERYPRHAIRSCADKACGWLFLDPSGRRRWCEMAVCGNRAKARRYAERHRVR